jgi:hypothetical protein
VDVVEAYNNGQPVSFHRIVLCSITPTTTGSTGCKFSGAHIEKRSDLPEDSSVDVASTVTAVATGTLY